MWRMYAEDHARRTSHEVVVDEDGTWRCEDEDCNDFTEEDEL